MPAVLQAHEWVREQVRSGALSSAHDIAEGGLAVALAECCIAGGIGALAWPQHGVDPFGEDLGTGFVVSGPIEVFAGVPGVTVIGEVGGDCLWFESVFNLPVSELAAAYRGGLDRLLR
jgi:phosphoribosylformylglycinamidine synthase